MNIEYDKDTGFTTAQMYLLLSRFVDDRKDLLLYKGRFKTIEEKTAWIEGFDYCQTILKILELENENN